MNRYRTAKTVIPALFFALTLITHSILIPCFADTLQYSYDDLNRLIRTENKENGIVVEYQYDAVGNRTLKQTTVVNGLQVTLRKDAQNPLSGIRVYLFSEGGSYLGLTQVTDATGGVTFNVPQGTYKVRADLLGDSFWSNAVEVTTTANIDWTIPYHPQSITVNGTLQGTSTPLSGINVYLFSAANAYLGISQRTGSDGRVTFSLPEGNYKVRADYLGLQLFSALLNGENTTVEIPMAETVISVLQGGAAVGDVNVYAFSTSGSYLGLSAKTDPTGKAGFRLPSASYKFRADYLGSQYWSHTEPLTRDQITPITIDTGGGTFVLTLLRGLSDPLNGVQCYAFSDAGTYLGLSGKTNESGQVSYNLPSGNYRFRVDYLGYQHWTDTVSVPDLLNLTKIITHQAVAITVTGTFAGIAQPKAGVPVYLFTPSGAYLSLKGTTDAAGQVSFNLPQQAYKVRADYLGRQYWSEPLTWEDRTIAIPEGTAHLRVTLSGQSIPAVRVYVFTAGGAYLGVSGTTDASGSVDFRLPEGTYKFRADYLGSQYWSTGAIQQNQVDATALETGGGTFTLTIDRGSGPLAGARAYLFNAAGSYLGLSGNSDANGQVTLSLPSGSYKFRVDYLGYPFWSDPYNVPAVLSGTLSIPHKTVTIGVEGGYQGVQPIAGVNLYLFTPSRTYLGRSQTTDSGGHAAFSLPNRAYRARADYLGYSFWSAEFQNQDTTLSIPRGLAQVTVSRGGSPISGAPVYLFSPGGAYLGVTAKTNAEGQATFAIPNQAYKFRVDEGGPHWSAVVTILEGVSNPVPVSCD